MNVSIILLGFIFMRVNVGIRRNRPTPFSNFWLLGFDFDGGIILLKATKSRRG